MAENNFNWNNSIVLNTPGYVDKNTGLTKPFESLIGLDGYPTDPQERIAAGGTIFYNIEMARKLRQIKKPVKNLVVDVMARPNYLALVVYEENIMQYEIDQRADIMEYLLVARDMIQSYGVRCELEGAKGSVRRQT